MKTRLTQLLGIEYPIICGAMARVSTPKLVSAVSNAGALGVLATGSVEPDTVRKQIKEIRRSTTKPFAVNIVINHPNAHDIAQIVLEENIEIVMTGGGNPSEFINMFKPRGIKVIPVVPSVKAALKAQRSGADAIVAEGMESGGQVGETTTMCLVPQVRDAVSIPLAAAGGIGDGRTAAAAFVLGAEGVQLGTRFLLAQECEVHDNFKNAVIAADDMATEITGKAIKRPVRVLTNEFTQKLRELEASGDKEQFNEIATGSLMRAVMYGDMKTGSMMCGQIAGLLNKKQSARDIILEISSQADTILRGLDLNYKK